MINGQHIDRRSRTPRIPSPAPPADAAAALLRRYDAGEPLEASPVAEGLLNHGYRVLTTAGTYFLKCYVDRTTAVPAAIAAQHHATAALHALGLPTAPPLAARDGRTVVAFAGRRYALFPWVDGSHRAGHELTPDQCAELGTLLGAVHLALARVHPPVLQPLVQPSADPVRTEELIEELLALAAAHRPQDELDLLARQRLLERRGLLASHAHRRPRPDAAPPTGWVHGDFHPLNLLYRGSEPVAILDWDRLGLKPRAEEAVRGATLFFHHPLTGALDLVRVRRFSQAYRAAGAAGAEEMAAAVHRVWWERLNDFWMLQWRYQRGDHRADPLFPAAAAQIVSWCEEYEQVLDAYIN
ncbi:phosphotransferase [Peterkaempfera sp. SMS 1(5)a]|uniref:phosphotransferase n=1 Tax=Peterkaempfera podocarpi TaxID=3232308 RepID=UPI003672BD6D